MAVSSVKFAKGDKIVYPMYGAGHVISIKKRNTVNGVKTYYEVYFELNKTRIDIPCASAERIGLRPISRKRDCKMALDVLCKSVKIEKCVQWRKHHQINIDKLTKGDLVSVAEVIQNLLSKKLSKNLSATENKTLQDAKNILASEISLIEKCHPSVVFERIENSFFGGELEES
jgi:CarD family transcriptional regulator